MNAFRIVTDVGCDLDAQKAKEMNLASVAFGVTVNDMDYENDLMGRGISIQDFYAQMRQGAIAKTSAPSPVAVEEVFRACLAQGEDILYIGFSSGLSSAYQTACVVAEELRKEYPQQTIITIDSLCASLGQGLLVYYAYKMKNEGKTIEEIDKTIENMKLRLCHWFTVDDLNHLKKGGRISPTVAFVGSLLSIKPVLHVDDAGTLQTVSKARGRQAAINDLYTRIKTTACDLQNQTVFISHADCIADAQLLAEKIKELGVRDIYINYIGPVIGSHSGIGTLAVFFLSEHR